MNFLEFVGLIACVVVVIFIYHLVKTNEEISNDRRINYESGQAWSKEKFMLIYLCIENNKFPNWRGALKTYVENSPNYYIDWSTRSSYKEHLPNLKEVDFKEREIDEIISEVNKVIKLKNAALNNGEEFDTVNKIRYNFCNYKLADINLIWSNNQILVKDKTIF